MPPATATCHGGVADEAGSLAQANEDGFTAGVEAKKTPGVFSPKGPKGAAQKRHLESFSPHRSLAPRTGLDVMPLIHNEPLALRGDAACHGEVPPGRRRVHSAIPGRRGDRNRKNVLAKPEVVGYTSGRPMALSSTRLNWRRRGAHPLQQAHDAPRSADRRPTESPPEGIIAALANRPTPCYTGTNPKFRILCGCV